MRFTFYREGRGMTADGPLMVRPLQQSNKVEVVRNIGKSLRCKRKKSHSSKTTASNRSLYTTKTLISLISPILCLNAGPGLFLFRCMFAVYRHVYVCVCVYLCVLACSSESVTEGRVSSIHPEQKN